MIRWNSKIVGKSRHPTIIFLHGFLGSLEDWLPVCRRLLPDYHCLLLDLPGHGKTEATRTSDYTMSVTARSLIEFLSSLDIRRSVIVGYSMGGRLALYLAVQYPHYFEKVILESASPGLQRKEDRLLRRKNDEWLATKMKNMPLENFLNEWYNLPIFKSLRNHPKFKELLGQRLASHTVNWTASLRGMGVGRQPPLWKKLKDLTMPILILAGEKDQKFRNISFQMKKLNPDFTVSIVPRCGHVIHFEDESRFYLEVIKFLTDRGESHG